MAKVLVVDDSLSVRKVVERALLGRQMEVVCAATGGEALERIERDEPDIVVCDVLMPDKDGYEICTFVKQHPRLAQTPVLLMSGIVNDEVRERAARVHSADVLSKPFAADDLLRKLDALLAAATPPTPPVEPAMPTAPPVPTLPGPASVNGAGRAEAERNGHGGPPAGAAAPTGTSGILKQFVAIDGVQWAVLADREGFLLDASGEAVVDAEVAGALSACLTESSEGLGRELGRGTLQGMILEYTQGMVVLYSVGPSALLAIALSEPTALGKVRYFAKKSIPELLQAV
jgi:CheY-like chemotaxis protein/predicted regulator of Ras-like GTPase activity (Roadblock/LC7/MglB family)